jgi:hypothetical protein
VQPDFAFVMLGFEAAVPGSPLTSMTSLTTSKSNGSEASFTLSIPQTKLDLLQQKLSLATFPDELDNAGWKYGSPLADIQRLAARWKEGYDWRRFENALNSEMPMFTRDVEVGDGHGILNLHYVHKRSERDNAIPLLFVHGCE